MKRIEQETSSASSMKRSSASGSRSIAISVPSGPSRSATMRRVPASPEGAVDRDRGGWDSIQVEQVEQLLGEHRDVNGGHVKQDGQREP